MEILPINAADLLQGPETAGLRQVYSQLEVSQEPGQALYFARENPRIRRPEFLIGLADRAYFALQVAVQPHGVEDGKLVLVPARGRCNADVESGGLRFSPCRRDQQGCQEAPGVPHIRHSGSRIRGGGPPTTPCRPGPSPTMCGCSSAPTGWWTVSPTLRRNTPTRSIPRPTMAEIQRGDRCLQRPGVAVGRRWRRRPIRLPCPIPDLTARQVIIQHADTVNVYTIGAGGDGVSARRQRQGWQGGGHEHALTDGCSARCTVGYKSQQQEEASPWPPPVGQRHHRHTRHSVKCCRSHEGRASRRHTAWALPQEASPAAVAGAPFVVATVIKHQSISSRSLLSAEPRSRRATCLCLSLNCPCLQAGADGASQRLPVFGAG